MDGWRRRWGLGAFAALLLFFGGCDDEPRGEPNARIRAVVAAADTGVLRLPDGDTLHLSPEVLAFYRDRGYRQAWTDYDEVKPQGLALLQVMRTSERDGLDPERYRSGAARRMLLEVEEDSLREEHEPAQMGELDLVLSEVFTRYAGHLVAGTIDPAVSGLDWRIERDSADVADLLRDLASGVDPEEVIDRLRPDIPEYARMADALERYRTIERRGGWPEVPESTPSEVGERGAGVALLRMRLIAEGDPEEVRLARMGEDVRVLDENLKRALEHFQWRHGIIEDGVLGPSTLAELNTPVEDRVLQLKLNMDRWRWLPRELGERYVLVNVAGFELEVVEDEQTVEAMRVVVGKEAWATPIFRDTMEYVVTNPYWTATRNIAREEIIPAVLRDPGYLVRNHMDVLAGDRVVPLHAVDWDALADGDYVFRQRPGPWNALGQVKFMFPNEDNIYLHDTPSDHLFSETSRAFSHGCIRVERPLDLARLIVGKTTERSPESIDALLQRDQESWIRLDEPLPVYILYFTAWVDDDGAVRFHRDIYDRDRTLEPQAREELEAVA